METDLKSFEQAREILKPFILPSLNDYLTPPKFLKYTNENFAVNPNVAALAKSSLKITKSVSPKIDKTLTEVCEKLKISRNLVNLYVFPDSEVKAFCYVNNLPIAVGVSSGTIKSLNHDQLCFVLGHEIGHALIGSIISYSDESNTVEDMIFARALELSSDRIGLIATKDFDTAAKTILIILSGLDDSLLRYDYSSFIDEAKIVIDDESLQHNLYSSHPPLVQRLEALTKFSICSDYLRFINKKTDDSLSIAKINQVIIHGLDESIDSKAINLIKKELSDLYIWVFTIFVFAKIKIDIEDLNKKLEVEVKKEEIQKAFTFINSHSSPEKEEVANDKIQEHIKRCFQVAPRKLVRTIDTLGKLYPTIQFTKKDYIKTIMI